MADRRSSVVFLGNDNALNATLARIETKLKALSVTAEAQNAKMAASSETAAGRMGKAYDEGTTKAAGGLHKLSALGASFGLPMMSSLDTVGKKLDETHAKTGKLHDSLAALGKVTLVGGGLGLAAAAAEAVKYGMAFQSAGAKVQGAAGISVQAAQKVTSAFADMGGKTEYSGQQLEAAFGGVAGQLKTLSGQALTAGQATGFMTAAAKLNEATQGNLASTTAALSAVMQAYHLKVGQAAGTSNTLFTTSKALNVPIEQLAQTVDKLHGRLGALSPSLNQTATVMVAMAEHGLSGGKALLAVNTAFQAMANPSAKAAQLLQVLGAHLYDAQGHFVGLQSVITQLGPKFAQMTQHQQNFAAATLFGKSANQAMLATLLQGNQAYQQAAAAVQRHNAANQAATAQEHTLHGEMETLKGTVDTLAGKFGLMLIPKLEAAALAVRDVINWFGKHKSAAEALAITIGSVLGLAVTVFAYTKAVAFVNATKDMVGGIGKVAGGIASAVPTILAKLGLISGGAAATATTVEVDNAALGASFGLISGGALAEAGPLAAAEGGLVAEVRTANAAIEASNAAAGASFAAVLGPFAAVGAIGAALAASGAGGPLPAGTSPTSAGGGGRQGGLSGGGASTGAPAVGNQPGGFGSGLSGLFKGVGTGAGQQAVVGAAAAKYGIPANVLWGVYGTETTYGKNDRTSSAGAMGAFQFMPGTAKSFGYPMTNNPNTAQFATQADSAARYLSQLYHQYGNWNAALNAYNGNSSGSGSSSYTQGVASGGSGNNAIQGLINTASTGKQHAAKAIKTLLYANPLPGMTGMTQTDMGVDFSASPGSAVNAIGQGIVTSILQNWYKGQPLIEEQLTQGPNKGQYVYYAEQLRSLVHIGQQVSAGQRIGTVAASGTGLELGFGAAGGQTLSQLHGTAAGRHGPGGTPEGQAFLQFFKTLTHGIYTTTTGGVTTGGGQNFATTLAQAVQAFIASLQKAASGLIQTYQTLEQSGTVKTLTKALGVSTGGATSSSLYKKIEGLPADASAHAIDLALGGTLTKSAGGSQPGQAYNSLVASLVAVGQKTLAAQLVAAHKAAIATLAQEMYAEQVTKDAESLNLQATFLKDQTQMQANTDAATLNVLKATQQRTADAMSAASTAVHDMTQLIGDRLSAMAQSVEDSMQRMADAANAVVTGINDQTQIQVDVLGERGLYGLNLVAQKLQVQSDITKQYWDQQIALAQLNLDTVTGQWHTATQTAQLNLDQVTIAEDQRVALAQQADDTVKIAQTGLIAAAQAHSDAVTLHFDTAVVGPAQTAVDLNATAPKAQQDVFNAVLKKAQGLAGVGEGDAGHALEEATAKANRTMAIADQAFTETQGMATIAIDGARQTLTQISGEATLMIDSAKSTLQGVQGSASIAEAQGTSAVSLTRALASTQFAGSGLTVNIYGAPMNDAAAIGDAFQWVARSVLPTG